MKKIFLSVLAVVALSLQAQAQTPDFKLGAKAGVNFANLSNAEFDGKTAFHVGVVGEFFINDKFSVQPEILYSRQGAKLKNNLYEFNESFESKITLDYIHIPIMAKYNLWEGLNVQFGPQVGFLTKAEEDFTNTLAGVTTTGVQDIKNDANKVDFGLNFGLGYELGMGVFFDARYNLGLTNVNKKNELFDYSNRAIQLSVGYKF